MGSRYSFNTLAMIFGVVAVVAVATWVFGGGEYAREKRDGRTVVVPGSYAAVPSAPQGIGALFMAPVKGFIQAAQIIAFLFVIGGAFMMIQETGAVGGFRAAPCTHVLPETPPAEVLHPGHHDAVLDRRGGVRHGGIGDAVRSHLHPPGPVAGVRFDRRHCPSRFWVRRRDLQGRC